MSQWKSVVEEMDDLIKWYHKHSNHGRLKYTAAKIIEITSAAAIPLLAVTSTDQSRLKYMAGILGAIVTISASFQSVFHWHEKWISWRSTWQELVTERMRFHARCGGYANEELREKRLAMRLCRIVSGEYAEWRKNRSRAVGQTQPSESK